MIVEYLASDTALRDALAGRRAAAFTPPSQLTADEWADKHRVLPSETSAITRRWETAQFEVARGPMRALTEVGVRKITIMASAQIMKTSTCETAIAYFMATQPCPILVYQPTDDTAQTFVDTKLDLMIKSTPALADLWGGRKRLEIKRDDFTTFFKKYPGGFVEIMTAQAVANLGMRSAKIVIFDEADKFKVTRDGDVIALGEERLKGFTGEDLSIRVSTPTVEGESPIAAEYAKSDQRRPYVECPHCGEWHWLKWKQVSYKGPDGKADPAAAAYYCEGCGCAWSEADRVRAMTTKGSISWRQTRPFLCCDERQDPQSERIWNDDGRALCKCCGCRAVSNEHAGFWASELYHPRRSLSDTVKAWLDCQGDTAKLQNFVNSKLAELWTPAGERDYIEVDADQLSSRVELPWENLPDEVAVITMGVDVQPMGSKGQGRIEAEVVGWGQGDESWSLAYHVIYGDPTEGDVWAQLDEILQTPFATHSGRQKRIAATCIDTGGDQERGGAIIDAVTSYASKRKGLNVWPTKGASEKTFRAPIWPSTTAQKNASIRNGVKTNIIGTQSLKDWISSCLSKTAPGPGYMHVPSDRATSWFEQMVNVKKVYKTVDGRRTSRWVEKFSGARKEAIDCRAYAKAALEGLRRTFPAQMMRLIQSAPAAAIATQAAADQGDDQPAVQALTPVPAAPIRRRPKVVRKSSPAAKAFWGR